MWTLRCFTPASIDTSMVWPTLGSRKAKEQNRTEPQILIELSITYSDGTFHGRRRWNIHTIILLKLHYDFQFLELALRNSLTFTGEWSPCAQWDSTNKTQTWDFCPTDPLPCGHAKLCRRGGRRSAVSKSIYKAPFKQTFSKAPLTNRPVQTELSWNRERIVHD